jgi:CTP:molybdopterin cytidylyltransferase MocA
MVAAEQLAGRRTPPRAPADAEVMAALGGDMPFAAAAARRCVESLIAAPERVDAVVTLTADGRSQPLAAAYRAGPFVSAVRGAAGASGRPPSGHDLSLKAVLDRLRIQTCPALIEETADVDTIQDLERARIIWAANSEPANAAEGDQG